MFYALISLIAFASESVFSIRMEMPILSVDIKSVVCFTGPDQKIEQKTYEGNSVILFNAYDRADGLYHVSVINQEKTLKFMILVDDSLPCGFIQIHDRAGEDAVALRFLAEEDELNIPDDTELSLGVEASFSQESGLYTLRSKRAQFFVLFHGIKLTFDRQSDGQCSLTKISCADARKAIAVHDTYAAFLDSDVDDCDDMDLYDGTLTSLKSEKKLKKAKKKSQKKDDDQGVELANNNHPPQAQYQPYGFIDGFVYNAWKSLGI